MTPSDTRLAERWAALCSRHNLRADAPSAWQDLYTAYRAEGRAYHNLDHIAACLACFDSFAHLAENKSAVKFAIWFHDIVYDSRSSAQNEERSSEVAASFLAPTALVPSVTEIILATKHHTPPGSRDAALMCDIDLSILGSPASAYDVYANAIREEYNWLPAPDYAAGRAKVLHYFLDQKHIYHLEEFRAQFEAQARKNLQRELDHR